MALEREEIKIFTYLYYLINEKCSRQYAYPTSPKAYIDQELKCRIKQNKTSSLSNFRMS